jgi:hypothetical protein
MGRGFFKFLVLVPLVLFSAAGLYPQGQEIIPLSSEIYGELDALYLIQGMAPPSAARPWTVNEALLVLGRIDESLLNSGEASLYDHIASELSRPLRLGLGSLVRLDANMELALEAYTHTNSGDYVNETDWIYGYEERRPLVFLSVETAVGTWFYLFTDIRYGRNRFLEADEYRKADALPGGLGALIPPSDPSSSYSPPALLEELSFPVRSHAYSSYFLTNVSGFSDFDFQWPKRAVSSAGGGHWNLSLARDRINWGNGHTGNFIVDDHVDFQDFARFSIFTERFRYEWLNVFFMTYPYGLGTEESFRILMAHRLEFRFFKSLSLALSESVMYQDGRINLRYFNPAFIFHNQWERSRFNAIAQGELDFTFARGFKAYLQFALDQMRAPAEDDSQSAAWGALAGIEHARLAGAGVFTASLEGAYTTPLLYRRDKVDFLMITRCETVGAWDSFRFDYIGYPYGGDAIVLQLDASWRRPGIGALSARLFGMIHGKMNPFISHNDRGDNTGKANLTGLSPSGGEDKRELTLVSSLRGDRIIPWPLRRLSLSAWAQLDLLLQRNKLMYSLSGTGEDLVYHKDGPSADLQFSLGMGLRL